MSILCYIIASQNDTQMGSLKKEYRDKILKDKVLLARIAQAHNKSFITVERWVKSNSQMLTTSKTIAAISLHTSKKVTDLVDF